MALLSGKTTDGRPAWDKYVRQNTKWKDLTLEIEKGVGEVTMYKRAGAKFEPLNMTLVPGDSFKLVANTTTKLNRLELAQIRYKGTSGFVPINKIRKPSGFDSVKDETIALERLDGLIKKIGYPINIQIKGEHGVDKKVYKNITGARTIAGTPKADFACYGSSGNEIFISHKKAGGAKAFQQYSGVTEQAGTAIYQHPEVKSFMREVAKYVENDKLTTPVYRFVRDSKLINLSIFGPNFGKMPGIDNCQLIGQGDAMLIPTQKDGLFYLSFDDHIALNGEVGLFMSGDYAAVLAATFRAGRGYTIDGQRVNGARLGIYPLLFIKGRKGAIEV